MVLAFVLVLSWTETSRAGIDGEARQDRNPIEWLLSDLGKLLQTATSSLKQKTTQPEAKNEEKSETRNASAIVPVAEASQTESAPDQAAENAAADKKSRNPLAWFLSDLARIFQPVLEIEQNVAHPGSVRTPAKVASSAVDETSPQKPAAVEAPTVIAATPVESSDKPKNPIAWLFSDLAKLLSPKTVDTATQSTGISDTVEAAPTPAVVADETHYAEANSENATAKQTHATPAEPATRVTTPDRAPETVDNAARVEDTPSRDPISWLLRDIASLLSPKDTGQGTDKNISVSKDMAAVPTSEPTPAMVAADAQSSSPAALSQADETKDTGVEMAAAQEPLETPPLEIAPWVPRPESDPFNPEDSLFTINGTPLLAAVPAASEPIPVETVALEPEQETPVLRTRAPYRPLIRNHAALGHAHKSVTPDPVEDSLLDRVLENLFGIDNPVEAEETLANKVSDRIVPEEKLDLGYISPDAHSKDQELTKIGDGPLKNIDLFMGRDSIIGAPYDAAAHNADSCVERSLQGSVFCLKNLNWPPEIAASFATDTAFVLPGEGVVRYENGAVSRVYAVFKAGDFADVVKFMQHRFGPPQEREIGWMHMLEAPRLPNTTFRWKAFSADHSDAIVLEVRNFDDLRRSFADMDRGMVRLYRNGSRPIFKHISTMDLMLMQRRRLANAPVEVNQPPKQQ